MIRIMTYETFTRNNVIVEEPALALAPRGRIALNAASTRIFESAGVKAVKILWDKEKRGIALQAADRGERDTYSVAFSKGRSASVTTRAFFRYIGWTASRRLTVPAKWNPELRILEAELPARFVGVQQKREGV